ncbi:MAG: beta-hydroxyacyl-ACP dehydratase [Planctomycetes bacterium]|nr:beta-hydroxyacyl-ACP dehydratase [Planctomycetota bacterium]OQY99229.1 MAG: hypothetical protein B6D36_16480 [Planctomycetes bacterium UTPLA1]
MPPPPIIDPSTLDTGRILHDRDKIYKYLPQRFEFAQLDGIIHVDTTLHHAAGIRNVRPDEWWCRGHMPGHPIFPGVLMLECAAQLAGFVQHEFAPFEADYFLGFGGVENCKFRGSVIPPAQIILVGRMTEARKRRFVCDVQSYLDGEMVFEASIYGMPLKMAL